MKTITDNNKTSRNIKEAYHSKKYIVTYRSIYQPFYSQAQDSYYAQEVYYHTDKDSTLTKRGRFFHFDGDYCNRLIGFNHLANL